jgi:putative ribosome biogenesis GTPase RsgA
LPDSNGNGGVFLPEGLILKGVGGFYQVESREGLYECRVRGLFRKKGITPLPGDYVDFTITDEAAKEGWIEEIRQRRRLHRFYFTVSIVQQTHFRFQHNTRTISFKTGILTKIGCLQIILK